MKNTKTKSSFQNLLKNFMIIYINLRLIHVEAKSSYFVNQLRLSLNFRMNFYCCFRIMQQNEI